MLLLTWKYLYMSGFFHVGMSKCSLFSLYLLVSCKKNTWWSCQSPFCPVAIWPCQAYHASFLGVTGHHADARHACNSYSQFSCPPSPAELIDSGSQQDPRCQIAAVRREYSSGVGWEKVGSNTFKFQMRAFMWWHSVCVVLLNKTEDLKVLLNKWQSYWTRWRFYWTYWRHWRSRWTYRIKVKVLLNTFEGPLLKLLTKLKVLLNKSVVLMNLQKASDRFSYNWL